MPITNTTSLAGPFLPNGTTTIFPFAFNAAQPSDVSVFDGDGAVVSPALYTVALYEGDGGTVTFAAAPAAVDYPKLWIALTPSFAQNADFTNAGPTYDPVQLTIALDAISTRIVALNGVAGRALKAPIGEGGLTLSPIAEIEGKALAIEDGKVIGIDAVAAIQAVADEVTAAAAGSAAVAEGAAGAAQGFRGEAQSAAASALAALADVNTAGATQLSAVNTAGAEQTALVTAAGAVFLPLTKGAKDGGALGQTAIEALSVLTKVTSPGNALATSFRWAKAFDAGAVNDDNTVVVGSIIAGITIQGGPRNSVNAATVRGRVWQRALTSAALNGAPGSAGDVLISDSGAVPPPADWPNMAGVSAHATVILPVPEFETKTGFTYLPDVEWRDAANALLVTNIGIKQLGANLPQQRYAGFSYTSAGASSWTASNLQRPWALGLATRSLKSISAIEATANRGGLVPAAAAASLLTPMERLMLEERGAWNSVKRPGVATVSEGLAALFGDAAWTPGIGRGEYGVDFGPTTPLASLVDGTTLPNWEAGTKRILLSNNTVTDTVGGRVLQGFKLSDGAVDIGDFRLPVTLRDFDIRTASGALSGVSQANALFAAILLENGHIQGQANRNLVISNGTVRRCSFDLTGSDNIGIGGTLDGSGNFSVTFEQILARRPGHTTVGIPSAHGDVFQLTTVRNFSITGSTLYFPGSGTTYDEGVSGATNVLRIESGIISNAVAGRKTRGGLVCGNLLIGAGYTIGLAVEGAGQSIENYLFLGNRYGAQGAYTAAAHAIFYTPRSGDTTGFHRNIAFFDEFVTNGAPAVIVPIGGGAGTANYAGRSKASWEAISGNPTPYRPHEEKFGIFDFNRAALDAKTIEALNRYGKATGREILRWNNDINPAYDLGSVRGV